MAWKMRGGRLLGCRVVASSPTLHDLSDQLGVDPASDHGFHHRQMFQVVMCLKERITSEELHQDTPDAPDVTWETPAQVQDNLRSPIMPCRNDGGVVLIIKGGRAEVDQSDLAVEENTSLASVAGVCVRGRGNRAVVGEGLVGVANKEDVFGFQIGMDEVEVVKN